LALVAISSKLEAISKMHLTYNGCETRQLGRRLHLISTIIGLIIIRGQGILFLPYKPGAICKCTVLSTGVFMPFQPSVEKASHPVMDTGWSLTARPDEHGGAVKWQRAPAAWIGKSGGVFWGDTEGCFQPAAK
jgi:hypothetical protein